MDFCISLSLIVVIVDSYIALTILVPHGVLLTKMAILFRFENIAELCGLILRCFAFSLFLVLFLATESLLMHVLWLSRLEGRRALQVERGKLPLIGRLGETVSRGARVKHSLVLITSLLAIGIEQSA